MSHSDIVQKSGSEHGSFAAYVYDAHSRSMPVSIENFMSEIEAYR